ncbi:MAG: hypothetical protein E5Y62_31205 [Mesorhizobium sp.]|nr:MAG: hypothetical protein E5Y62_31205 [Mesorhizobium sp.]
MVTGRRTLSSPVSPIAGVAERTPRLRPAGFSPFTGRRCRQADEGRPDPNRLPWRRPAPCRP